MVLTLTSTFEAVYVGVDAASRLPSGVWWREDDDERSQGSAHINVITEGGAATGDLAIIQQIYASDDGFQDSDGNTVAPTVETWPISTDVEDLEGHGLWNPLDADSYARYLKKRQLEGDLARRVDRTADSDTERVDWGVHVSVTPKGNTPSGDDYSYPLADWRVYALGADFRLYLAIPSPLTRTSDDVAEIEDVRALMRWLNEQLVSGETAVGLTPSSVADMQAAVISRDYDIAQSDSETIRYTAFLASYSGEAADVESVSIYFERHSGSAHAYDRAALESVIQGATGSVPVTEDIEKTPLGAYDHKVLGNKLETDSAGRGYTAKGGAPAWRGQDTDDTMFDMRLDSHRGREVKHSALPLVGGVRTARLAPFVDTIHLDVGAAADAVTRLPTPPDLVVEPGYVILFLHNRNATRKHTLEDWGGTVRFTLLPKEKAAFRVALHDDGSGTLTGEQLPRRQHVINSPRPGDFGDVGYLTRSSNRRLRPLLAPSGGVDTHHADAFEVGAATFTDGDDIDDVSSIHLPQAVKLLMPGLLRLFLACKTEPTSSNIWLPSGHGYALWRQRGTNKNDVLPHTIEGSYSGDNKQRPVVLSYQEEAARVDDIYLPLLDYNQSASGSFDNLRIIGLHRAFVLEPIVEVEYDPDA